MKFRTRMILAYAMISLFFSTVLGLIVYRTAISYETRSKENNLVVSAKSYAVQMDDRLSRMDAIMYYILSDASMLESMTILGRASSGALPVSFVRDAQVVIQSRISTEYIMKNSYRTVYFTESGFRASSAVKNNTHNQRLIESFSLDQLNYLDPVTEADGHSVIVGAHQDFWGAYESTSVFSLMKAPRGYQKQYLEVENRLDSLDLLETSDPGTGYAILINGNELLYVGGGKDRQEDAAAFTEELRLLIESDVLSGLEPGETFRAKETVYARSDSDTYSLSVLAFKPVSMMYEGKNRTFLTSFLAALVTLAVSLVGIVILSHILTKPVKMLQTIMEETNIDNLQDAKKIKKMDKNGGLDEFTNLAHSYQAMTERLDTALQNEKRSAMLQLQAQFDTLQAQVNPHFIYNVLNVISSRAVIDNDEEICEMCGSLGNMLRYSTNNKARYARISEEVEYLDNYFYLLKARYENRLQVRIDIDSEVMDVVIPKMTLQQIVENSIKHGFNDSDKVMEISLIGRKKKEGYVILIQDNGAGADEEKLQRARGKLAEIRKNYTNCSLNAEAEIGGIGLTNTFARCLLLFGESLVFEIGNRKDGPGFAVRLEF